jgi:hypothetical protein
MTIKAGVWIDHHKAVVVLITEEGDDMLQIRSEPGASMRLPAGARLTHANTQNDFAADGQRERTVMARLNEYYDQVVACVRDAQAILILGPVEARGEFRRRIGIKKFLGHVAEMKTAANLTDQQISDYVRQHFL